MRADKVSAEKRARYEPLISDRARMRGAEIYAESRSLVSKLKVSPEGLKFLPNSDTFMGARSFIMELISVAPRLRALDNEFEALEISELLRIDPAEGISRSIANLRRSVTRRF